MVLQFILTYHSFLWSSILKEWYLQQNFFSHFRRVILISIPAIVFITFPESVLCQQKGRRIALYRLTVEATTKAPRSSPGSSHNFIARQLRPFVCAPHQKTRRGWRHRPLPPRPFPHTASCWNKTTEINDLIIEKNADLVFISETLLKDNDFLQSYQHHMFKTTFL